MTHTTDSFHVTRSAFQAVRSALFVPATRPERIVKAAASGADAVIIDLEDAVSEDHKTLARDQLHDALRKQAPDDTRLWVRINATDTPWFDEDLAVCAALPAVAGIMLPKTESADDLHRTATAGKPLCPLLESARGYLNLADIANTPRVERLTFGALDTAFDLGLENGPGADTLLDALRAQLILHSRASRLAAPLESIVPEFRDLAPLQRTAQRARQMGFGGMLCIHPAQLPVIHEAFGISAEQQAWAQQVLDAAKRETLPFQLDGRMIDEPVLKRARQLLQ